MTQKHGKGETWNATKGRNTFSLLSHFYLKLEFKRITTEPILTIPVTRINFNKCMSKVTNLTAHSAHEPAVALVPPNPGFAAELLGPQLLLVFGKPSVH